MSDTNIEKLHFVPAETSEACDSFNRLKKKYGQVDLDKADCVVVLGGDGSLLHSLHTVLDQKMPVYGMNCGSLGFLLNEYDEQDLLGRINKSHTVTLSPLSMVAYDKNGKEYEALAFNEVSLFRDRRQTAKLRVYVDGVIRLSELVCDGALVTTPAGSTAYNFSAHGPIIPLEANVLALTPISAFRPRRWRGAILPSRSTVRFEVLESDKRPVSATADFHEIRDVKKVDIRLEKERAVKLLFDDGGTLEERIMQEQFSF